MQLDHSARCSTLVGQSPSYLPFFLGSPFFFHNFFPSQVQSVQVFGRKKTATAVCYCKAGKGLLKINGSPIDLLRPEIMKLKVRAITQKEDGN